MPSDAEIAAALARVGMGDVELDVEESYDSVSAAWACRCISIALARVTRSIGWPSLTGHGDDGDAVGDYLLQGGRSSVLARGIVRSALAPAALGAGWSIGVPNPLAPGERLARSRSGESGDRHLRVGDAVLRACGTAVWASARSADRLAGGRRLLGDRRGADRGRSRCVVDGVLRDGGRTQRRPIAPSTRRLVRFWSLWASARVRFSVSTFGLDSSRWRRGEP